MKSSIGVFLLVSAVSAASGFSAHAQSIGFSISETASNPSMDQITVTVLDDQTLAPIPGASVTITDSLDFTSKSGSVPERLRVNREGVATFMGLSPLPKTVTISKDGYATLSVVGVQSNEMTGFLKPVLATAPATIVASGTINNWDGATTDDESIARAGLVFRSVSALDLLDFQIANFVSPLKDNVDFGIGGKHDIPSNTVIPQQTVSYAIFSIDLDKTLYRLPIPSSETVSLTGVEIEADVGDIVSVVQSKKFTVDLLNKIRFKRAGITQSFSSDRDVQQDITATMPLTPQHQVSIAQMPPFTSDVVAASFTDLNGDKSVLVPSDAKAIFNSATGGDPVAASLVAPDSASPANRVVATIAMGPHGQQISGVLTSQAGATVTAGAFLNTDLLTQDAPLPATVTVHTPAQGVGAAIFETNQPVWYVYTLPIAGDVAVPTSKLGALVAVKSYSVNQIEFSQFDQANLDGTKIMSLLQRFARSSATIK